jgi:hypothetical protein
MSLIMAALNEEENLYYILTSLQFGGNGPEIETS